MPLRLRGKREEKLTPFERCMPVKGKMRPPYGTCDKRSRLDESSLARRPKGDALSTLTSRDGG